MSTATNRKENFFQYDELLLGGMGAACAGFFTNPLEVVKTRIQLQGELRARGQYTVHYRNVFHAFYAVAKAEGFTSLQKGLAPALWYQFIMNGCRFGAYQMFDNLGFTRNQQGDVVLYKSIPCGVSSGILGSFLGSPFYLVKTQLQTQSTSQIAVGHQHGHASMTDGFRTIYSKHGIFGLWRGSVASMTRVSVGGSIQLTSFSYIKTWMHKSGVRVEKIQVE